jgi:hypothetical protein
MFRLSHFLVFRQSAHMAVMFQPYTPATLYPQEDSWYSFLLEAELTPKPLCRWKDYVGQLKNPMTLGIEPMTFHLVAQCLNQLHYHLPPVWHTKIGNIVYGQWSFLRSSKNIPPLLCNYFAYKNPLPDHILSQINSVHALTQYLFMVHFNIVFPSMPCIGLSSGVFS